jgi:ferric-dicitrate binding protein FerR (iron transport regulator)
LLLATERAEAPHIAKELSLRKNALGVFRQRDQALDSFADSHTALADLDNVTLPDGYRIELIERSRA